MGKDDDIPEGFEEKSPKGRRRRKPEDDPDPKVIKFPGRGGGGGGLNLELASEPLNDLGTARRFIARFGDDFLFVPKVGLFHWDGKRWNIDEGEPEAIKGAHVMSQLIWEERRAFLDYPPKDWDTRRVEMRAMRLAAFTEAAGQTQAVKAMIAAVCPYIMRPLDMLDADAFLCTCENGTVELGDVCELRESRRDDLLTRKLDVPYIRNAQCPKFEEFVRQIMPDEELCGFLQRILGYCLAGSTREQVIFLFHGSGNNGKSTLMNVVRHIMGDYAMVSPVTTFLASTKGTGGGSEASPDLARLPGARLVTASEPPERAAFDEGRIKEMTGGEPMTARHLNKPFFSFKPVFKLVMLMNNLPAIRGVDHGIWRRIRVIPFEVQIADADIDRDLDTKLIAEAPGILQWIIRGFEWYREIGLAPPASATALVDDYRADQDIIGQFIRECCEETKARIDPGTDRPYEIESRDLREVYKAWCDENKFDAKERLNPQRFGARITSRGLRRRKSNSLMFYQGLVCKISWLKKAGLANELTEGSYADGQKIQ